ncbi:MAG TPA: PLP-dependent aminotransferase family protein [Polyangiaceae bacterium]
MRRWQLSLNVRHDGDEPVFRQIARAIEADVRRGRLRPGDELPGTRTLAEELEVHRNTVAAAYAELAATGWISAARGRGTFVARELPDDEVSAGTAAAGIASPGFPLEPAARGHRDEWPSPRRGVLALTGAADARMLPVDELGRAYRRAARSLRATAGHYADGRGHPRLLAALGDMLATLKGIGREREIIVTRGSQMGLFLLIEVLFKPGDAVAIEDPGYEFGWDAFRRRGVELLPVPVDAEGLRVDALRAIAEKRALRAVLTTPSLQYPTTVPLSPARRRALLDLASEQRFAVIEDDFVRESRYEGPPILPLASEDTRGVVVHLGTLSKVWMPSVRLGYVAAAPRLIDELVSVRQLVDVCGDPLLEVAIAELIEDGALQRHFQRMRSVLRSRRDALASALREELGDTVRFREPNGGTLFWVEVDDAIDVEAWAAAGRDHGVLFLTGNRFFARPDPPACLLLVFATLDEKELREAVRRMARALRDVR